MMNWSKEEGSIGPVQVTVRDKQSLLADLSQLINEGTGFSIATLNLDHVVKLRRDRDFRDAYFRQTHVTADGNPIVWLSRLAGQREISLVPGSELILPIARLAAEKGVPIGLFGSTIESLNAASDALKSACPQISVVYCSAPAMGFDPEGPVALEAMSEIGSSGARIVFLALGAPKQERFSARAQTHLPAVGFVSIGAGLDFISGAQKRAPAIVRAIAAEWLWRLLSNPRRLAARYIDCILVLPGLTFSALSARRNR